MKSITRALLIALCICLLGVIGTGFAAPVYLSDYAAGGYYDADKSGGDSAMCWAAAASNVLAWSGWGDLNPDSALGNGNDEGVVFDYVKDNWLNIDGQAQDLWQWWFYGDGIIDATSANGLEASSTYGGLPGYTATDYLSYYHEQSFYSPTSGPTDADVRGFIDNDWGTVISLQYGSSQGHAVTLWGYDIIDSNSMTLYMTDSDRDGQSTGDWSGLDINTYTMYRGQYLDGLSSNPGSSFWWNIWYVDYNPIFSGSSVISGLDASQAWAINTVRGLELYPDGNGVIPEPGTMVLLGSGLIGFVVFGRKRFK